MRLSPVEVEIYLRLQMNQRLTLNCDWAYTRMWAVRVERALLRLGKAERRMLLLLAMGYRGAVMVRLTGGSRATAFRRMQRRKFGVS